MQQTFILFDKTVWFTNTAKPIFYRAPVDCGQAKKGTVQPQEHTTGFPKTVSYNLDISSRLREVPISTTPSPPPTSLPVAFFTFLCT